MQVLRIVGESGLVKLGNMWTDGTNLQGNASRHKAMSYGYMKKEIERLREEIEALSHAGLATRGRGRCVLGQRQR